MLSDKISDINIIVALIAAIGLPIITAVFGWVVAIERKLARLEAKVDALCSRLTGLFREKEREPK